MKTEIFDLIPRNGRKSFNGKAKVIVNNGVKYLLSYNTIIGGIDREGKPHRYNGYYSATTNNHVKSFFGYTREFWELPLESNPRNVVIR